MKKCPVCNNENKEDADKCIVCGTLLNNINYTNSIENTNTSNIPDYQQEFNPNINNNTQLNQGSLPQNMQQNIPQNQQMYN